MGCSRPRTTLPSKLEHLEATGFQTSEIRVRVRSHQLRLISKSSRAFPTPSPRRIMNDKKAAYKNAAAKWDQKFGRNLAYNGIDAAPNFAEAGLYAFRLVITPEAETSQNWKFRIATRLQSLTGNLSNLKFIPSRNVTSQIILLASRYQNIFLFSTPSKPHNEGSTLCWPPTICAT